MLPRAATRPGASRLGFAQRVRPTPRSRPPWSKWAASCGTTGGSAGYYQSARRRIRRLGADRSGRLQHGRTLLAAVGLVPLAVGLFRNKSVVWWLTVCTLVEAAVIWRSSVEFPAPRAANRYLLSHDQNRSLEGRVGFGPTTSRLKVGRSTTELTALDGTRWEAATIVSPAAAEPVYRSRTYLGRSLTAACSWVSWAAVNCAAVIDVKVLGSTGNMPVGI